MAKTQESKRVRTGESGQGAAAAGGMDVESGERCSASLQIVCGSVWLISLTRDS